MTTRIEKLTAVARQLHGRLPLAAILQTVTDGAAEVVSAPRTSLRLLEPSRTRLIAVCRAGATLHHNPMTPFQLGEGLVGWIAQHCQPLRSDDAESDPRFAPRPGMKEPMGSFVGVPLMAGAQCMGVLSAVHPDNDYFSEEAEQLLVLLATIAAPHVEIARLSRLMRVDSLTGTLNRRGLHEAFPDGAGARATDKLVEPLSVGMVDIDRFKQVNDEFGHAVGDEVLRAVSERIAGTLRAGDGVVRYGGEEFLLILPEADRDASARIADRARLAVCAEPIIAADTPISVTISAGVAQRRPGEPRDDVIERADRAMYAAKRAGRNRVELAD
ncbi:MAG: sensor domain-containing diguanylate cyclase [Deltaproteobacteria bacterium]|jgi:diguanylate cyclase (GGDEF)-like protein|nr:sensor domain-containing diguanylate cyclase [Deltaproteobacteria bacterium]MBW2532147.1 sensor domain-containing diguanylate cyclase [Deltaproteobacteria bacterium]